jgi:hypothetical protein
MLSSMLSFNFCGQKGQNPLASTEDTEECYHSMEKKKKLYYAKNGVAIGGKVLKWQNKHC